MIFLFINDTAYVTYGYRKSTAHSRTGRIDYSNSGLTQELTVLSYGKVRTYFKFHSK
jgi:hypothetical protein